MPAEPDNDISTEMPPMNGPDMGGEVPPEADAPVEMPGEEMSTDDAMPEQDPSGEDPDMDDGDKKEIQKATGTLSNLLNNYQGADSEDNEELKKYVEGMIDSALEKLTDEPESEEPEEEMSDDGMPMESVRFTKGQLKRLNENFNTRNDEEDKRLTRKKEKRTTRKTPFNAPDFK